MFRWTRLISFCLALLIAVTSQQMAVARGMTQTASGQVILCTGQGLVAVSLDADGNPVEPAHICPDCALTLMAAIESPAQMPVADLHMQRLAQTPVSTLESPSLSFAANARAPPSFV